MSNNHGNTPAAWTAVAVALAGFVVGGVGLMLDPISYLVFWVGVAMVVAVSPLDSIVQPPMSTGYEATLRTSNHSPSFSGVRAENAITSDNETSPGVGTTTRCHAQSRSVPLTAQTPNAVVRVTGTVIEPSSGRTTA